MGISRPLTKEAKEAIKTDPFYKKCIRHAEGNCQGRLTHEHALYYGGKRMDDVFAILPVCAYHHGVDRFMDSGDLDKDFHRWVAINRMTDKDMAKYDRVYWKVQRNYLNNKYGNYHA